MPKRKSYPGRNGNQKRTYYKKRRLGPNTYSRRTFVPRTMGPFAVSESKYTDTVFGGPVRDQATGQAWNGTELDPTATPANTLFAPPQGTGIDERVGRSVHLYKLSIRGILTSTAEANQADILSSPFTRLILYIDQQTNGVQSQGEDVIGSIVASTDLFTAIQFHQNINNFGRFRVLKDVILRPRIVTAGTDGANTNSQNISHIPFKMSVKFPKPLRIKFDGTTAGGSVADIVDNSLHLIGMSSNGDFTTNLSYSCRGYYKDV